MILDSVPSPDNRLYPSDRFSFSCHKGLVCFNSCCRDKHLLLTPYDILRLKNALKIHSDDFLSNYTLYDTDPKSGFPVLSLKLGDAPERLCPFVGKNGCRVYAHRPTACRLFPLGRASGLSHDGFKPDEFFFLVNIKGCLGFEAKEELTISRWLEDQEVLPYIEMNDKMLEILFHPKRDRNKPLDEKQLRKVMVACYNLDVFRDFVFNTNFLPLFQIDGETCSKIEKEDEALLNLGLAYLRKALF
ncbi:conserved hypothetical protein [uncultured Desulfobacterium sp.]|uniref:YkgJ family cysteine cluster protein n=1 Tax=uncultured Desulfobacterium sp. TaxID=201089 RepID=A0A445MZM6_9BACT|nr:conserved hypothetical protein [uncultured Desulfobacterium sp.]